MVKGLMKYIRSVSLLGLCICVPSLRGATHWVGRNLGMMHKLLLGSVAAYTTYREIRQAQLTRALEDFQQQYQKIQEEVFERRLWGSSEWRSIAATSQGANLSMEEPALQVVLETLIGEREKRRVRIQELAPVIESSGLRDDEVSLVVLPHAPSYNHPLLDRCVMGAYGYRTIELLQDRATLPSEYSANLGTFSPEEQSDISVFRHDLAHIYYQHKPQQNIAVPLSYGFAYGAGKAFHGILPRSLRSWMPRTPLQAALGILGICGGSLVQNGLAFITRGVVRGVHEQEADEFAIRHAASAAELASAAAGHGYRHNGFLNDLVRYNTSLAAAPPAVLRDFTHRIERCLVLRPSSYERYARFCRAAEERLLLQEQEDPLPTTEETRGYLERLKRLVN